MKQHAGTRWGWVWWGWVVVVAWLGLCWCGVVEGGVEKIEKRSGGEPKGGEGSELVTKLLADPLLTDAQRRAMAIFHGRWEGLGELTTAEQAAVAMGRYDLNHPSLRGAEAGVLVRARAALERGDRRGVVAMLEGQGSVQAVVLRARALEQMGETGRALEVLEKWGGQRGELKNENGSLDNAAEKTAAAEAMVLRAELLGQPGRVYQEAMGVLGRVRNGVDRLYWPAMVVEGRLLIEKDNPAEAQKALAEVLALNPKCGEAWWMLGEMAAERYNFEAAQQCVERLREINPEHVLADLVEARGYLYQKDPASAERVLRGAMERYPEKREVWAEVLAAKAMGFDEAGVQEVLERLKGSRSDVAMACWTAGQVLSAAKQYGAAEAMLNCAVENGPNWPWPRIELGVVLMQAGREGEAEAVLRAATALDPFNRRAHNLLTLAEELRGYEWIETEHFVVRYKLGVDAALALDISGAVEGIHRRVTGVFGYKPARKTLIEILPDEPSFAVRMTGMPDIWTVAACSGDLIALTPPRGGAGQAGPFDWARVIEHEYVHTVTLNMTGYRVPHWFTEACAVWLEPGERGYEDCRLLAWAVNRGRLFRLEDLDLAFIRPKEKQDRPLAYAQSSWMAQYLVERFGYGVVVKMLGAFAGGATTGQALRVATGVEPGVLMGEFKNWAGKQVEAWGLGPHEGDRQVEGFLKRMAESGDWDGAAERLEELLTEYPGHPELLRVAAEGAVARLGGQVGGGSREGVGGQREADVRAALAAVTRYAVSRPVDPWSYERIVELATRSGDGAGAIAALEQLDRWDVFSGRWAYRLAQIHRAAGRYEAAAEAAERALHRRPYRAESRELAAAVCLQAGLAESALRHVRALTAIEPDRAVQWLRLGALYHRLGRSAEARGAVGRAVALDPKTAVPGWYEAPGAGEEGLQQKN